MDGRPPPAPPPQDTTTTPKPTRRSPNEDLAARTAPQPSGHPNPPQASTKRQPTGNNNRSRENSQSEMEAFIRQWGASTNDISDFSLSPGLGGWASTSSGFDLVGSSRNQSSSIIRTDRSASFDNNESDANNNVSRSNNTANSIVGGTQPNNVQRCATFDNGSQHRRISSTGGDNRGIISSSTNNSTAIPQHLFDGLVLGGATDDNDPQNPNNTTHSTMDNILNGGMSALHDAARITDWDSVAALSTSNPESAKYVGPDGWNALHHACDRRCPHVDVIDLLLNAHPEAIIQTNDKGWTPLHRACRNKTSKDVVKLLLNKYIELGNRAASMRCNDGRSALHYALLYDAPEGVVDLLLAADPHAVLDEDRDGVSPLGTVWDKYANAFEGRRMLQVLLKQFDGEGWELGSSSAAGGSGSSSTQDVYNREQLEARLQKNHRQASDEETAERIKAAEKRARDAMEKTSPACKVLQTNWNKANTLLRAYFRFPLQEEDESTEDDGATTSEPTTVENTTKSTSTRKRKWRILHAVSSIKCHPKLFLLARALHPEQALEIDENDLYANGRATGESSSSSDPQSAQLSQRTALHFAAMSPLTGKEGRNVVKVLLKLNPNAASHVDGYGSLPLHLICENVRRLHWTNFGPLDIYNAYPEATSGIDGSGKTPLHCASASSGQYMSFYPRPVSAAGLPVVSEEESVIRNLVEANGTAASIADNTGRLPLHYIAERLENWSADVQAVLDAHPAAAQTRAGPSTSNQLPLHMAASSPDARPQLIMGILGANPRAASIVDGKGRLPLHLAVDSGRTTWDNGIASIYMAYTPAISKLEESPRRWTVLHAAAASKSAGCDLIKAIISLAKNTASVQDSDGRYPLHLACASNRSWEDGGMKDIFDADPSAALSEDVHGLLPFHIAAMRGSTAPSTTTNSSTPSSTAAESEQADNDDLESLEVLFVLLRSQPSIVQL